MKTFSKWTIEEVEETFDLIEVKDDSLLQEWLSLKGYEPSPKEKKELQRLQTKLRNHVLDWNEEELKMKFIGFLLDLVDFDQKEYQSFMEREVSVVLEDRQKLFGSVDFMIAKGKRSPKVPFFCLHEYKKERYSSNDPLGQLLIAMVAAQKLNQNKIPLYGAYTMGRLWYFLVLQGSQYSLSLAYDATKDDIKEIWGILSKLKSLIEIHLEQ